MGWRGKLKVDIKICIESFKSKIIKLFAVINDDKLRYAIETKNVMFIGCLFL